jgi:subtilisin family serine protease
MARAKYYDFIVLPARGVRATEGVAAATMGNLTAMLDGGKQNATLDVRQLLRLNYVTPFKSASDETARYMNERGANKKYSIRLLAQDVEEGPMAVKASAEGERLLRAAGFRVLKQQRYQLIAPLDFTAFDMAAVAPGGLPPRDFRTELYLESAWRNEGPKGAGVVVGVVDTGVDAAHPALQHAVAGGRNLVVGEDAIEWGPCPGPQGWHGTHVAGIIGARDPGALFPEGVAPEATVRSYRVFGGADGRATSSGSIINAILMAIDDGCDIINLSLGGRILKEDGVRDAVNEAWDQGVICVAAAGNAGRKAVTFPAAHYNCVGVSAVGRASLLPVGAPARQHVAAPYSSTDPDVFLANFSNIGPQIDFAGPGVEILSTIPGGGYAASSGTSMAAPVISGFAAVALSRDKTILTAKRDKERAAAMFGMLSSKASPFKFGSFDYEGYGVPR